MLIIEEDLGMNQAVSYPLGAYYLREQGRHSICRCLRVRDAKMEACIVFNEIKKRVQSTSLSSQKIHHSEDSKVN